MIYGNCRPNAQEEERSVLCLIYTPKIDFDFWGILFLFHGRTVMGKAKGFYDTAS